MRRGFEKRGSESRGETEALKREKEASTSRRPKIRLRNTKLLRMTLHRRLLTHGRGVGRPEEVAERPTEEVRCTAERTGWKRAARWLYLARERSESGKVVEQSQEASSVGARV